MAVPPVPAVCGQQVTGKKQPAFKGTGPVTMFTTCAPVISSLPVTDEVTQHIFWGAELFRTTFIYLWLLLAVSLQALLTPLMAQFLSKGPSFLCLWWTLCVCESRRP